MQPSHGGFGYKGPGNDMSVTGFQYQAMKAALVAGLRVPKEALERAQRWLAISQAKDYSTPYRVDVSRSVQNQKDGKLTMTAANLAVRLFLGQRRTARECLGSVQWLVADGRHLAEAKKASNFYAIYYLTLSTFTMGGKYWRSWRTAFAKPLLARQTKNGVDRGSWPSKGAAYGSQGGRVYTTAMACLALESPWKYPGQRRGGRAIRRTFGAGPGASRARR
jgi:hypothetical protein